jgi:hypothetical protein
MESRILGSLGKIAGVGGIALGVFLLIYKGVLQQQILPLAGLGSAQGFAIILSLMIMTFGIAGIGLIAWLIARSVDTESPVTTAALATLAALIVVVLGAAVFVSQQAKPDPVSLDPVIRPTAQTIPPPPTPPAQPINGIWDVTMSCAQGAAVNEFGALFTLGRYARAFKSPSVSGMTELAIGYISDDIVKVTRYVVFGQSDVYTIDATGRKNGASFSGIGRFGSETNCKLTVTEKS